MQRGRFITFEGIEGVGKSSNIRAFQQPIEARGHTVLLTREPGGTPTAERIRDLVSSHSDEPMPDIAELLLVFAARAVHVENVIRPALEAGRWVLCDRFTDSSRAYQGGGRGINPAKIDQLADWVHADVQPDLTVLLDAPVDIGRSRVQQRGEPDRFEIERTAFFERVRARYLQLASTEPQRFVCIDASRDLDSVMAAVEQAAQRFLDTEKA